MRSWGRATAVSAFAPNTLMGDEGLSLAYSHSHCPQCVSVTTLYFRKNAGKKLRPKIRWKKRKTLKKYIVYCTIHLDFILFSYQMLIKCEYKKFEKWKKGNKRSWCSWCFRCNIVFRFSSCVLQHLQAIFRHEYFALKCIGLHAPKNTVWKTKHCT